MEVSYQGVERQIDISAAQLSEKASQRYTLLINKLESRLPCAISHRLERLPGLAIALQQAGFTTLTLQATCLSRGVFGHLTDILSEPEQLRFITQLPVTIQPENSREHTTRDSQVENSIAGNTAVPTHVLYKGHAIAIGENSKLSIANFPHSIQQQLQHFPTGAISFEKRNQSLILTSKGSSAPMVLNDQLVTQPLPLKPGDVIVVESQEFTFIRVEDGTQAL